MASTTEPTDGSSYRTSLFWLIGILPPLAGLHIGLKPESNSQLRLRWLPYLGAVAALSLFWVHVASRYVQEPYLDEIFHIPQAQTYGQGRFREWDDKLTTPPGLYLFSLLVLSICGQKTKLLSPSDLRATNAVALVILGYLALLCRHEIELLLTTTKYSAAGDPSRQRVSSYSLHSALNICLFPLLFFFSGLYYTDVISTAAVLASFLNHLRRVRKSAEGQASSLASDAVTLLLGIVTLFMRQTNVFWTVVFMGGLEAIQAVKTLNPKPADATKRSDSTLLGTAKFYVWRSSLGDVHDVPLSEAWVEDWVYTAISLLIAGLCTPLRVIRAIWPYLAVLASFAGFVVWNGGVVLGDKSNHVATIHLAQMLYIWPFFAFFSLPLLLPPFVSLIDKLWAMMNMSSKTSAKGLATNTTSIYSLVLAGIYVLGTVALSFAIVHFNTIIHPFTLADNRHYMFYVFRYTIRRATWIRYALVLAYTASRWLVWGTLSGSAVEYPTPGAGTKARKVAAISQDGKTAMPTSTAIIFLLATILSLITAPLVEPRYFIIPWVIWRLLVPAWYPPVGAEGGLVQAASRSKSGLVKTVLSYARQTDVRLVLETAWFLMMNLATIGIFILKPYQWRAEDGTLLDEGRLQRFMW